jgi:hypothetical protein
MVILQFIVGFIMGIYLMEILSGYWATKKLLAALTQMTHYPEGRKGNEPTSTRTFWGIPHDN